MREYTFDIAVVGGGGSGVCAALKASEAGKKVVLLEKAKNIGGSTAMCGGIGAVGSKVQEAAPECDFTVADLYKEFADQTNYLADTTLIYTFVSNSGETVDWLMENGCEMEYVGNGQARHIGSKFKTFFNWGTEKIRAMKGMLAKVEDRGGMTLTATSATELVLENGSIAGLKARTAQGDELLIHCKAVVICSGGYGNNKDMVDKALGGVKVNMVNTGGQTGDGINMGIAAGAATENLYAMEFHGFSLPFDKLGRKYAHGTPGFLGLTGRIYQPLWVNNDGLRFTNEEIVMDNTFSGNVTFRQGSAFYVIINHKMVELFMTEGIAAFGICLEDIGPVDKGNLVCPSMLREIEDGYERKLTYKGDTIGALAQAIGLDSAVLAKTMADYNAACEAGVDLMYGKSAKNLMAMTEGPYYAIEHRAAELCSLGGLKINTRMQVLDPAGRPIPGLYAAGCDAAGGLFNNAYVSLEGMTLGWACTSGRRAGPSAAADLMA